jgi:hypothetical protein
MHHLDGRPTAQKKSVMKQKLGSRLPPIPEPASSPAAVTVDFPESSGRVVSRDYTIRISTEAQGGVEVSIDDGAWRPCRQAAGFWWHDWSGYGAGSHSVFARVRHPNRRGIISERREFIVELG